MTPGEILGKFALQAVLGRGGFGEVWRARDAELGRDVALKILRAGEDAEELARFQREARTAAALEHPHIAAIYEVGARDGLPYIAMQLIRGRTLKSTPAAPREAARILRDAARAVAFAHERGIIHRDLKPENLMLEDGRVYVMDFGLARAVNAPGLTLSGVMVGTPAYMSPEQAQGRPADPRSNVWGLGATLYERLAGRPPFDGDSVFDIALRVVEADPVAPRRLNPAVPADLETVVLKCLEKDPARRYAAAGDLADDLDRFLSGDAVLARPTPRVLRLLRRHRRILAAGLLALLAVAGVAGVVGARLRLAEQRLSTTRGELIARMRERSAVCLDAAIALRRAGDLDGMNRYVEEVEAACADVVREAPGLGEPHRLLGRRAGRRRHAERAPAPPLALARRARAP